jgi:hypothetical protein
VIELYGGNLGVWKTDQTSPRDSEEGRETLTAAGVIQALGGSSARPGFPEAAIDQTKQEEAARIYLGRRGEPDEVVDWILRLADPTPPGSPARYSPSTAAWNWSETSASHNKACPKPAVDESGRKTT